MELRNINTFLHIAELHSFSSAARELGYSQSAVSAQISQLETELGTPLFDRVGKTVRLTDAGQDFPELCPHSSHHGPAGQGRAGACPGRQRHPSGGTGRFRMQHLPARPAAAVPRPLPTGGAGAPHRHRRRDAAAAEREPDRPGLHPRPASAPAQPDAGRQCSGAGLLRGPRRASAGRQVEVPLDVLAQQEFLLTERGMSYRDALDQRLAARGLSIHPYIELGSASLLCQMVERGMGLSFLPEYIVRPALSAGRIARLNVPDCTVTMHRQLFYHKDKMAHAPDESLY